jgi:hypothetical protein
MPANLQAIVTKNCGKPSQALATSNATKAFMCTCLQGLLNRDHVSVPDTPGTFANPDNKGAADVAYVFNALLSPYIQTLGIKNPGTPGTGAPAHLTAPCRTATFQPFTTLYACAKPGVSRCPCPSQAIGTWGVDVNPLCRAYVNDHDGSSPAFGSGKCLPYTISTFESFLGVAFDADYLREACQLQSCPCTSP